MNKATRKTLTAKLTNSQSRAKVRRLSVDDMLDKAKTIETFLRRKTTPVGTTVKSNWPRVANCYPGIPEGTFVSGYKEDSGTTIQIWRSKKAFGSRAWTITHPGTGNFRIVGKNAHESGSTDDLLGTTIVNRDI